MNPQNENLILDDCCEVSCCGGVTTDKNRPQERPPEADCCLVTCCDEPANDVVETSEASLRTAVRKQYELMAQDEVAMALLSLLKRSPKNSATLRLMSISCPQAQIWG